MVRAIKMNLIFRLQLHMLFTGLLVCLTCPFVLSEQAIEEFVQTYKTSAGKNLTIKYIVHNKEHHGSVFHRTLYDGLAFINQKR